MSLLDILFLFLVFLFPILAKSIQEKQRIEQGRRKKTYNATTKQVEKKKASSKERKSLYEEKYKVEREPISTESNYETFESEKEYVNIKPDIQISEISPIENTKPYISKLTKNDLVKGIVLKEILSEPKCMKYM